MSITTKIKKSGLVGCGGGCFPTSDKWEMVKKAKAKTKFVICNCSEGEPDVKKDDYLFANYPEKVINGMKIAIDFLAGPKKAINVNGYIYINEAYNKKYGKNIKALIKKSGAPIDIFVKPHESGYIGGEETTILNVMEGEKTEPRLRPPYPTTSGLLDMPTLMNNVETFYHVSLIESGEYKNERFFTITGDVLKKGVYKFPAGWSIERILRETGNFPKYKFFVQVGGGGSGEVFNHDQLARVANGAMSLTIYKTSKWKPKNIIKKWVKFFMDESCGQCTPCREGTVRLFEIIESKEPDWDIFNDLLDNLDESSFCGLGCVVSVPIRSYVKNVLKNKDTKINTKESQTICECFK